MFRVLQFLNNRNLDKFPASAQRLFSLARLYLDTGLTRTDQGFIALFNSLESQGPTLDEDCAACGHQTDLFTPLTRSAPLYVGQTFIQWKSARDVLQLSSLCLPRRQVIYLLPVLPFPAFITDLTLTIHQLTLGLFEVLQSWTQIFFLGYEVLILPPVSPESRQWSVREQQAPTGRYCVDDLLPLLEAELPRDGLCVAGLTWADLYPQGFNSVLGQASYKHKAAVVSFGRGDHLAQTGQDIGTVDGKLLWQLFKTLTHELCHLFGLDHCKFFRCAMNESSAVSQALAQPLFLCPVCLRKVQASCRFDVLERYKLMLEFLHSISSQLDHCNNFQESSLWLQQAVSYLGS
ncbi:archaemetzincin-2-like isoform X2 [Physella acuta]|uniref:archaemetzincin-2-like isoform X2 n=1 Tax=Physella acuta TaxID=109671 RepID=UPI0027DE86C2|nr:archaemetzincin-2-like isoform X2 [Physella acuta]XP_059156436.1 archaemetzincin-2-like isoform X2 [Physella acuta]